MVRLDQPPRRDMKGARRPVALVTGGSSGIGAAVAKRLAAAGHHVAIGYYHNRAGAEGVARACQDAGPECMVLPIDVADATQCATAVEAVLMRWSRMDCLISSAGTTRLVDVHDLQALSGQDFTDAFSVNVTGAYQIARASEKTLKAARGAIVTISSHAAFTGFGSSIAYAASKGALNTLTLALARAMAPEVTVNAVCPGFVDTDWLSKWMSPQTLGEFKRRITEDSPLRRQVTPENVAEAVSWFALGGRSITGQLLVIDSGQHLQGGRRLG